MIETAQPSGHIPVLLKPILKHLCWSEPISVLADLTFGGGGHLEALLRSFPRPHRVFAFDLDPEAGRRLKQNPIFNEVQFISENFSRAKELISEPVDRLVVDLGVSSFQLDSAERGFSFRSEGPLDMRMDPTRGISAKEWLESVSEQELADTIYKYGEERRSRVLARRLVYVMKDRRIETTKDLVEALGYRMESRDSRALHPLTRVFQAIRIQVNGELEHLDRFLKDLPDILAPGGRAAIITFHSLEDRAVKWGLRGSLKAINKKVIIADDEELAMNSRARSAKLRVYERLAR